MIAYLDGKKIDKNVIWESHISVARKALADNETNYHGKKKKIIEDLVLALEKAGMPLEMIANTIVEQLNDCNVSESYILRTVDKKYKRHYKKKEKSEIPEENEQQQQKQEEPIRLLANGQAAELEKESEPKPEQIQNSTSPEVDDNNMIEVNTGTNIQSSVSGSNNDEQQTQNLNRSQTETTIEQTKENEYVEKIEDELRKVKATAETYLQQFIVIEKKLSEKNDEVKQIKNDNEELVARINTLESSQKESVLNQVQEETKKQEDIAIIRMNTYMTQHLIQKLSTRIKENPNATQHWISQNRDGNIKIGSKFEKDK